MTSPELQAFVDVEIAVEGLKTPSDEQRLRSVIHGIPGVEEPTLYGGMLALRYDPISTNQTKICDVLVEAGFGVSVLRAAPASPITDATQH